MDSPSLLGRHPGGLPAGRAPAHLLVCVAAAGHLSGAGFPGRLASHFGLVLLGGGIWDGGQPEGGQIKESGAKGGARLERRSALGKAWVFSLESLISPAAVGQAVRNAWRMKKLIRQTDKLTFCIAINY